MLEEDDEIAWADEVADEPKDSAEGAVDSNGAVLGASVEAPINILVIDDDEEVHRVTSFTLGGLTIDDASVQFFHARTSDEARALLGNGRRFAVILLDVVMEDEESGFRLVRFIREELNERASRIIMRTGQPGNQPERDLILTYDINDYRNKTELTAMTLFTAVVTAARTYRDILRVEANSRHLSRVMDDATELFSSHDEATVESILGLACQHFARSLDKPQDVGLYRVSGDASFEVWREGEHPASYTSLISPLLEKGDGVSIVGSVVSLLVRHENSVFLILGKADFGLHDDRIHLLELLRKNVQIALDNFSLRERLLSLQLNLQRFVPQKALKLFDVQDVRGLEMGQSFELEACILFMRLDVTSFHDIEQVEQGISDVVQVILRYDGLVDKFTSDGLLAIFFHPKRAGHDALNAIDEIRSALKEDGVNKDGIVFDICFGVNVGVVTFGLVGYEERLELTVMGDSVNIAARIKAMCRILPCEALVSGDVIRRYGLQDTSVRNLGEFHLRGRKESIDCYQFLADSDLDAMSYRDEFEAVFNEPQAERRGDLWKALALRYPNDALVQYFSRYATTRAPHQHSRMTDLTP